MPNKRLTSYVLNGRRKSFIMICPNLIAGPQAGWIIVMQEYAAIEGFSTAEAALKSILDGSSPLPTKVKILDIPKNLDQWPEKKL